MKFLYLTLAVVLLSCQTVSGQITKDEKRLIDWRLSRIDIHNIGFGVRMGMNANMLSSAHLYYKAGSHRNLINAECGLKYKFCSPSSSKGTDAVRAQYLGGYTEAHINFVRWKTGAVYLGAGIQYDFAVASSYWKSSSNIPIHDTAIAKDHASASGKIGLTIKRWDAGIFIGYNMAPLANQKHIFESVDYNYEQVYAQTHERYIIGISLSYMIPL